MEDIAVVQLMCDLWAVPNEVIDQYDKLATDFDELVESQVSQVKECNEGGVTNGKEVEFVRKRLLAKRNEIGGLLEALKKDKVSGKALQANTRAFVNQLIETTYTARNEYREFQKGQQSSEKDYKTAACKVRESVAGITPLVPSCVLPGNGYIGHKSAPVEYCFPDVKKLEQCMKAHNLICNRPNLFASGVIEKIAALFAGTTVKAESSRTFNQHLNDEVSRLLEGQNSLTSGSWINKLVVALLDCGAEVN